MQHRIRSAAIIVNDNKILLVKHVHPATGAEWWVPPGGGVEGRESIYDCARREAYEETGLTVKLGPILYLREFIDIEMDRHHFEVFILASSFSGTPTITNVKPEELDAAYIKEARFISREEMQELDIWPVELKTEFWKDLASGKPLQIRYLGQQIG